MNEILEWKDKKILKLSNDKKVTMSFGYTKARLILDEMDAIKEYVGDIE